MIKRIKILIYGFLGKFGIVKFMRISSGEFIRVNGNGTFAIYKPIRIGGVTLNNVVFSRGVRIGNIDLTDLVGKDVEATSENGVYIISYFYERT